MALQIKKAFKKASPFISIGLFLIASSFLYAELKKYDYHEVIDHLKEIGPWKIVYAFGFTGLAYFTLTCYDMLAIKYIRRKLSPKKVILTSFVSYAFSNNMGLSFFTSTSVRYHLYTAWGLRTGEIARIVIFSETTFFLGVLSIAGTAFLLKPDIISNTLGFSVLYIRILGIICYTLIAAYLLLLIFWKRPFRFKEREFKLPAFTMGVLQIIVSSLDWIFSGSVLYVLLPGYAELLYPTFINLYLLGQVVGLASQVPGGIGVLESTLVLLLSNYYTAPVIFGSLLVYRLIYYVMPLAMASLLLVVHEILQKRRNR